MSEREIECEYPESQYRSKLDDGSTLLVSIIRSPRIVEQPDPAKPCAVAEMIARGESNPGLLNTQICYRCNQIFTVLAAKIPPKDPGQ